MNLFERVWTFLLGVAVVAIFVTVVQVLLR